MDGTHKDRTHALFLVILAFSIFVISIAPAAFATDDFSVSMHADKNFIQPGEVAYYTLYVTNNQSVSDLFTASSADYDWIVDTTSQGDVLPGQTQPILLELTPKPSATIGPHSIIVKVRSSNTGSFESLNVPVSLLPVNGTPGVYAPSIFLSAQVPQSVDPRNGLLLSVYLRNRNARQYATLTVEATSDIFQKEYTTSLGPIGDDGEKTNQITILLDKYTPPGEHDLNVQLLVDGQVVNEYKTQFTIESYNGTSISPSTNTVFFKEVTSYSISNDGNSEVTVYVSHPTNLLRRLFTDASADYTVKDVNGKSMLVFPVTLEPKQTAKIDVTENFRLLFILILLVALSVISYYIFRSPTVLRKEAAITGANADGVSKLKIRIFIKNRSAKSIHGLHVVDKVTSMADVVKESTLGTLAPTKVITKKGHGTLVRWDIDTLEPFEERIITYSVSTQLNLIGDVYLPAAKAKFDQRGRERASYSNEVNIPREG